MTTIVFQWLPLLLSPLLLPMLAPSSLSVSDMSQTCFVNFTSYTAPFRFTILIFDSSFFLLLVSPLADKVCETIEATQLQKDCVIRVFRSSCAVNVVGPSVRSSFVVFSGGESFVYDIWIE